MRNKVIRDNRGSALLALILIMPSLMFITASFLSLAVSSFRLGQKDQLHTHAQLAGDAGIDRSLYEVNQDPDWAGTTGETELHNDGESKTTYEVSVVEEGSDYKTVTSIGRSYRPITSTTPNSSINLVARLRPVSSGNFSVVTGVGGLYMTNNTKILGGNVQVNGEVELSNSAQIGLSTNPVTINVAHQNCPVPVTSSYPTLCGPGENGEPIDLSNRSHIYGDVKANNQTSTEGMSNPGLTASSGVIPEPLPEHDRAAQVASVANNQTGEEASCSSGSKFTKTWPANLKITGDVTIGGQCEVIVEGDVWITGKLTMRNSSKLTVSNTLGTNRPDVMVDGASVSVSLENSATLQSNDQNTGFQILTYWSRASCSPGCSDVTGLDLYASRNDITISMDNSASAGQTILYARWSRVKVSNSGEIGALVGQTVELSNSAVITFGTSAGISTNYWVIDNYRRTFN